MTLDKEMNLQVAETNINKSCVKVKVEIECRDENIVLYSKLKRNLILGIMAFTGLLAPLSSTIFVSKK